MLFQGLRYEEKVCGSDFSLDDFHFFCEDEIFAVLWPPPYAVLLILSSLPCFVRVGILVAEGLGQLEL